MTSLVLGLRCGHEMPAQWLEPTCCLGSLLEEEGFSLAVSISALQDLAAFTGREGIHKSLLCSGSHVMLYTVTPGEGAEPGRLYALKWQHPEMAAVIFLDIVFFSQELFFDQKVLGRPGTSETPELPLDVLR